MLFAIGTKVKFKHTGDVGKIIARLGDGMVTVYIEEDGMEIPTFEDDLVRVQDEWKKSSVKAKFVAAKKEKKNAKPPQAQIMSQYRILKSKGIQVAFDPVYLSNGLIEKYHIYLINDTKHDVIFTFELFLNDESAKQNSGRLPAYSFLEVGVLLYDQLNDYPEIDLECRKITTKGTGSRLFKTLKIKAKQFFKKVTTGPLINKEVHLYRVFEKLEDLKKDAEQEEDLKTYTQRNVRKPKPPQDFYSGDYEWDNVKEYAEFPTEIDLHIENLLSHTRKMNNREIIQIQLQHFESYLAKAIRLGVTPVFIIHGVGKGRLRDEIATRLIQNPYVETFKNEYHPRYGWGATEVFL